MLVLRSEVGPERGELMWLLRLAGDPPIDGVLEYRGGVLYAEPGVAAPELGGRPRSLRWLGVRGMSERSSAGRTKGSSATPILYSGNRKSSVNNQPPYSLSHALVLETGGSENLRL